jgi:hypothetical protein
LRVSEKESADLIVIGSTSRSRMQAWLNNDLWNEVSHKAACNVLRVTPGQFGRRFQEDRHDRSRRYGKQTVADAHVGPVEKHREYQLRGGESRATRRYAPGDVCRVKTASR